MIGVELLLTCQVAYLSNALYRRPTLMSGAVKNMGIVTGGWGMMYETGDRDILRPFTNRVEISSGFIDSSLVLVTVMLFVALVTISLKVYSWCRSKT
jgi:hypothetical protein